jgi:ADP-heptose:LPS heptosyltransferase
MIAEGSEAAFGAKPPYALLVPGGSPHRLEKRWPAGRYERLALELSRRGIQPVVIGGPGEAALAREIGERAPQALDLIGRTSIADLAALGAHAALAVGNDTGPLHVIAAAGAPTLALFSEASDPTLTAPRGPRVTVLRRPSLEDLGVEDVQHAAEDLL